MFFYYEEEKPKAGRIDHKKEIIKIRGLSAEDLMKMAKER